LTACTSFFQLDTGFTEKADNRPSLLSDLFGSTTGATAESD